MKITDCLSVEHKVFLQQLDRLEKAERAGAQVATLQAMTAMLAEPLELHAEAEETVLFPALEPHLGRQTGPLAVMDLEHTEIRQSLGAIEEGAESVSEPLRQLIGVLRDHIAKEDGVLFPMALRLLGGQALEEMAETCPHHRVGAPGREA